MNHSPSTRTMNDGLRFLLRGPMAGIAATGAAFLTSSLLQGNGWSVLTRGLIVGGVAAAVALLYVFLIGRRLGASR